MPSCRQCSTPFEIRPQDEAFYAKMNVPAPTLCHFCRRQRLLCWRNQRTLYARTCDVTKKSIISIFAPEAEYTVYDRDIWWGDTWDPLSYGMEFDFTKTFAEQFDALMHRVPMCAIFNGNSVNSQYCNHVGKLKDCYLTHASWECENTHYSDMSIACKDSMDLLEANRIENSYELVSCDGSYNLKYSVDCDGCTDSWFLFDCRNCTNCIGCTNLRNKEYYLFNEPYNKVDYEHKVAALHLDTRSGIEAVRIRFVELMRDSLHRHAKLIKCENATGNNLLSAKNCHWCFSARELENCAYCINGALNARDVYDGYGFGATGERSYYILDTGDKGMENMFCGIVWGSSYIYYSYNCHSSYELFGCTGVRGKKFCILNKQYSEDEYKTLKAKIIAHMRETGEWGEFFPPMIAPFGYNETLAQEYTPKTREQAILDGFKWQDRTPGTFGKGTIDMTTVPERIADTPDTIVNELLTCINCNRNYKIVAQELAFYKKHALPVPRQCPECRYAARRHLRNPHVLWHKQCMCAGAASEKSTYQNREKHFHAAEHCPNEFETVYAPERLEIVYCEACYQAEVV